MEISPLIGFGWLQGILRRQIDSKYSWLTSSPRRVTWEDPVRSTATCPIEINSCAASLLAAAALNGQKYSLLAARSR